MPAPDSSTGISGNSKEFHPCRQHEGNWLSTLPPSGNDPLPSSAAALCSVAGCQVPFVASGFCAYHFNCWRPKLVCSVDGCQKPTVARRFCWMHYRRYMKYGDATRTSIKRRVMGHCISCCRRPQICKRLCSRCYSRQYSCRKKLLAGAEPRLPPGLLRVLRSLPVRFQ